MISVSTDTPVFFIEQRKYTSADGEMYDFLVNTVKKALKDSRILQTNKDGIAFSFVGLISFSGYLLSVLPKYTNEHQPEEEYYIQTRNLVRVLQKYAGSNRQEEGGDFFSAAVTDEDFSEPVLADSIIDYYLRYGIWNKSEKRLEMNCGGSIDWSRTIDFTHPLISGRNIFYPDLYGYTHKPERIQIITRIHQWATQYCIRKYGNILPSYEGIFYEGETPEYLDEIGSPEMLITVLQNELRDTYIDVNVRLFINLVWLIRHLSLSASESQVTLYGTTSFHNVWELTCKTAFGDMSNMPVLKGLFVSPTWIQMSGKRLTTGNKSDKTNRKNQLKPDIIFFEKKENEVNLFIFDAKYYYLKFGKNSIYDNPGIIDVSKQILYQQTLQYNPESPAYNCKNAVNAFIFPATGKQSESDEEYKKWMWGYVKSNIPAWEKYLIFVLLVPPERIFEVFIKDSVLTTKNSLFDCLLTFVKELNFPQEW